MSRLLPVTALLFANLAVSLPGSATPLTVVLQGPDGQPLGGAVVGVLVKGERSLATDASAQIAQRERRFQPQITAIQTGTAVQFPNFDTVRHHVYSFSAAKRFELKLYAGTPTQPVVFDRPGVAALGCNIHDRMAAWVVVMDTPLIGRSDAAGEVVFDLPPGEHGLQAWHPGWPDAEGFATTGVALGGAARRLVWTVSAPTP